jgi:hypothetical protein
MSFVSFASRRLRLLLRQRLSSANCGQPAIVMADNLVGWEAALTALAASSALLEKLEQRPDSGSPQLLEAAQLAQGRLLYVLANTGPSSSS